MRLWTFLSIPVVFLAFAPANAATIVPSSAAVSSGDTTQSVALAVQRSRTEKIRFQRGATGATINSSVVRGDRDTFLVSATRRQTMTVSITSLERNAVFEIQGPNGNVIKQEATSWSGVLPSTGDYRIIVGGTRGNASYKLRVSVR
jgi:hypothetical protein